MAADTQAYETAQKVSNQVKTIYTKNAKEVQNATRKLAAENDRLAARIKAAFNYLKREFSEITNGVNKVVNAVRLGSQAFQELGQFLSITLAAPIIMLFKEGTSAAMSFEQQMAKVRKAVEMPLSGQAGYDKLEARIRNLAKITPTTVEQLGVFAEQAGQLGLQEEAVYRMVNLVNKLSIGTDVAADSITEDMGKIASAFGQDLNTEAGMKWMEGLASTMDMVAKKTATDMAGIVAAMKDAAVVGPQLKIPAEQLAAMTGILISAGADASGAGNNIQRFYTQVLKNADMFSTAMQGYSRDIVDANGQVIKSFEPYATAADVIKQINDEPVQVLLDSIKALKTADINDRAQALANFYDAAGLVGGRVGAMASSYKELEEMLGKVDDEMINQLTLQADYEMMLMTTQNQLDTLKNNLRDAGIELGKTILPVINQLMAYAIPAIQDLTKAFAGLDDKTKMLVIGIPLLAAALMPVMMMVGTLIHTFSLAAMAVVSFAHGTGQLIFGIAGGIGKLGKSLGGLKLVAKLFGVAADSAEKLGLGGIIAQGGLKGLWKVATGFLVANPIVGWAVAIIGSLKLLSKFGLDVGKYFRKLADGARTWGENLMATYGNGIATGAAKVVSNIVSKVAGWIANFFEAHSPPKEGPLSTIDQWGTGLMNTYLKGFLLADFGILSEVGSRIKDALELFAGLGALDENAVGGMFLKAREAISELIKTFNETGKVAEGVLSKIGAGLGSLGKEIQKLTTYWLDYKKLQEKLAAAGEALEGHQEDLQRRDRRNLQDEYLR